MVSDGDKGKAQAHSSITKVAPNVEIVRVIYVLLRSLKDSPAIQKKSSQQNRHL